MQYHALKIENAVPIGTEGKIKAQVVIVADIDSELSLPISGASGEIEGLADFVEFASGTLMIVIPGRKLYVWNETEQTWEKWSENNE